MKAAFANATSLVAEVVLQQEWDDGISPWPHCDAMCRQQADSSAVMDAPGNMHASTGVPASTVARRRTPNLTTYFKELSLQGLAL